MRRYPAEELVSTGLLPTGNQGRLLNARPRSSHAIEVTSRAPATAAKVWAIWLVAVVALIVDVSALMQKHLRDRSTVAITEITNLSKIAIRDMVVQGNLSQAANKLGTTYRVHR